MRFSEVEKESQDRDKGKQVATRSPLEVIRSTFGLSPAPTSTESSFSLPIRLPDDPVVLGALSALAGVGLTFGGLRLYRRYWRRLKNADDVTGRMLDGKRWINGVVTSVGDGDNFRLFHTPGPFFRAPLKIRRVPKTSKALFGTWHRIAKVSSTMLMLELRDQTLHIRISGVDAPENAHFGNPAQAHAKESLDWLRHLLVGKTMRVQLLRKDQYNRIVGVPYIHRRFWFDKPLPPLMVQEGMAVVYESAGAEYGPWGLAGLKKMESDARRSRKGLWGMKRFEHPAEYKKRMKAAEEGTGGQVLRTAKSRGLWAAVKRLFGGK